MSKIVLSPNASGSGIFTIDSPNSNSNRTISLPDAAGNLVLDSATQTLTNKTINASQLVDASITQAKFGTNVAGNGPTFRATKASGGNQTIGSNVWTKITYPDEVWDTNSNYDTSTSRFTPTVAGYYFVRVSAAVTVVAGTQFALYQNGVFYTGATSADWMEIATIVSMNGSTDYIEGYIYNNTGLDVFQSVTLTTFQAVLVRAG
jgi:hypothetical protein